MRAKFTAFLIGILAICSTSCEQWEIGETLNEHNVAIETGDEMATHPVTAGDYGGSLPLVSIQVPDDGTDIEAAHIQAPVTALLAEVDDIRNNAVSGLANKVDRTGDTMTGTLTITPSSPTIGLNVSAGAGSNLRAALFIADGSAEGARFEGGATGAGATLAAGGGNGFGGRGLGSGTGPGLVGIGGATAAGVFGQNGTLSTATAPTEAGTFDGYIRITAPNPNAGVDPGANGTIFSGSVARARGRVYLGGAPPFSFIGKPLNFVALVAVVGLGTTRVTMVRPMADLNYEVQLSIHGAVGYAVSETNIAGRTTTQFEFTVFDTTTAIAGVGPADHVDVAVFGEQ